MWGWIISTEGQAIATWGSDVLSFLAIVIALSVAVVEYRRGHNDRLAEIRRQDDERAQREARQVAKRAAFIDACSALISTASDTFQADSARVRGVDFVDWRRGHGTPRVAAIYLTSIRALQNASQEDYRIVMALSKAIIALEEIEGAFPRDGAPRGVWVGTLLDAQCLSLQESAIELTACR